MTFFSDFVARLKEFSTASGLNAVVVLAASVALATTPIAFAIMGRQKWFQARRGRQEQRPSFATVVVATLLVMGIPAILLALMVKSQYFDKDRYEFDPNRVITTLDEGRQFNSVARADEAVREERKRLAVKEKNLTESVKKLDSAMLALGEAATQSGPAAEATLNALDALGKVRQSVGVDAPHEWEDLVVKLKNPTPPPIMMAAAPGLVGAGVGAGAGAVSPPKASPYDREIANVPAPQKELAQLLPLDEVPNGWEVGDMGDGRHLETFNAENLYEKIDGRAESFVQYDVTGMAYTNYHPKADDSGEVQLYIFSFASPLKAFGKYGSEKPQDTQTIDVGEEGYAASGSVSFYRDKYFVQVVSTSDDPKYATFSETVARIVSAKIGGEPLPGSEATESMAEASPPEPEKPEAISPAALFKILPAGPDRTDPQYVAQDAFGYSFFSDVFLADYKEGDVTWQGFLRPYADAEEAKKVFEKYVETAKSDGADLKEVEVEGADRMVLSDNIGLFDAVFLKGNAVGGANGATGAEPAEKFARKFVESLPAKVPSLGGNPKAEEKSDAASDNGS